MNELDEILALLVDQVDGAQVAAVGGMDGLLVEQYPAQGRDLSATTAELTNLLTATRTAYSGTLDAGEIHEVIVTAEQVIGYTRLLGDDMFCLIVMNPGGNIGKARLYSEEAARRILEVFG